MVQLEWKMLGLSYDNMDMGRSERMSIQEFKKLARRTYYFQVSNVFFFIQKERDQTHTIIGNRIRRRPQTIPIVTTLLIRLKLPSQVMLDLVRILLLVQPVRRCLPHLHSSAHKRLLGDEVHHPAVHEDHLSALDVIDDVVAVLAPHGVGAEEGA